MLWSAGAPRRLATEALAVRAPAQVGAILVVLALAYWPTVRELSGFGVRNDGQFLIVFLAFAGMVWSRRHLLEEIPVQPFWPALPALLALGCAWLVGQIGFVRTLSDASVVLMVPVAVVALCGMRWAKALAFPLAFVLLAIPIEQPLAPVLAEWTASATIRLLELVGIPVVREGTYFTIPSGPWVVADACGGVKYLTSCLVVAGVLAPVLFRSLSKRAAFLLGALALAIVGNWIRAFLTILGAHLTNNQILRDDHSTFGWIMYALMFVAYCGVWWRFREENADGSGPPVAAAAHERASGTRMAAVAVAALAIALLGPVLSFATSAPSSEAARSLEISGAQGWVRAPGPATPWRPMLQNVANVSVHSFRKDGRTVDLFIGLFGEERADAKLVSVGNSFADPGTHWALASRGVAAARFAGHEFDVNRALVAGPEGRVLAWQWYWVNGTVTGSGLGAKLAQLHERLRRGHQDSAWIAVSVPLDGSADPEPELQAFVRDMGPAIEHGLAAAFRKN